MKKENTLSWRIIACLLLGYVIGGLFVSPRLPDPVSQARAASMVVFDGNKIADFYHTQTNRYIRIVNAVDLTIWDTSADPASLSASTTWANSDIAMSNETTTVGAWTVTIPSGLPTGFYYVLQYSGASPASTDTYVDGCYIKWRGGAIIEMGSL